MLNMKKSLALVLAAATAFTFAPVANLSVTANAAAQYFYFVDKNNEKIELSAGQKKTVNVDFSSLGLGDDLKVTAKVENTKVAHIDSVTAADPETGKYDQTVKASGNDKNVTISQAAISGSTTSSEATRLTIIGESQGTTNINLSLKDTNGDVRYTQVLTVKVTGTNLKINEDDQSFWKNDNTYWLKDGKLNSFSNTLDATVEGKAAEEPFYLTYTSSNPEVASFTSYATEAAAKAEANKEYFVGGNKDSVKAEEDGKKHISIPLCINAFGLDKVSQQTANITVKAYESIGKSVKFGESVTDPSVTLGRALGSKTFTVTIYNGTAELDVQYDSSNPAAAITDKTASYGTGYNIKSGTKTTDEVDPIYLDTTENTTANIKATVKNYLTPGFNTNTRGTVTPEFTVDYQGTNRAITVDNTGKVTVLAGTAGISEYTNYVVVRVPAVGRDTDTDNYIGANEIRIPVKVSTKSRVKLAVSANNVKVGPAVGTTGYSANYPKTAKQKADPKGAATAGDVTVSNKNNGSVALTFDSNVADSYIDASIFSDAALTSKSDIATYDKATKTIKAVAGKTGIAYVQVSALNDANTYGNASIVFVLNVTDKNANASLTVKNPVINLNGSKTEEYIDVTKENAGALSYELEGATDAAKHDNGIISVDGAGKVTFNSRATSTSGSAVVVVSAAAKDDNTLAPTPAKVTVNYNPEKGKVASTLTVSTQAVTLKAGESVSIGYTGAHGDVTFASDDEGIASVENNEITGVSEGSTTVTVSDAGNDAYEAGKQTIKVYVKAAKANKKPAKVKGVKVTNKKGAKVTVKFTKDKTNSNVQYKIQKQVRKNSKAKWGKTSSKKIAQTKTTLNVKKGYQVRTRVKAYYYDENGKLYAGSYSKWVTKKTDKK